MFLVSLPISGEGEYLFIYLFIYLLALLKGGDLEI